VNSPRFDGLSRQDFPEAITWESKAPVFDVAVCGNGSLLTHSTASPSLMVMAAGWNCVPSISTVWVDGADAAAAASGGRLQASQPNAATTKKARRA